MSAAALMRAARRAGPFACAASALAGCSLVLEKFDLSCSDSERDCAALNAGLEGACFVYQCRPDGRGCEQRARDRDGDGAADAVSCQGQLRAPLDCDDDDGASAPGLSERCDGKDNDCNGMIDDGALDHASLAATAFVPLARSQLAAPEGVVQVAHTDSSEVPLQVAVTSRTGDLLRTQLLLPEVQRDGFELSPADPNVRNCGSRHCNFSDVALAAAPDVLLALGVDVAGCSAGQLRAAVGAGVKNGGLSFTWDTQLTLRAQAPGYVIDPQSEAACAESGASSPSVALLAGSNDTEPSQALALWRAGSERFGLGLSIRPGAALEVVPGSVFQLTESALAEGSEREPASVKAWRAAEGGYFLGYASQAGVELAFLPKFAASSAGPELQRARIAREQVSQVVLALDAAPQSGRAQARGLAVSWREGTSDQSALHFASISYAAGDSELTAETSLELASAREILAGPAATYVSEGFMTPGQASSGGWFIAWLEQQAAGARVVGVRVAEATGEMLEQPFTVSESGSIERLFVYANGASKTGYGFVTPEPAGLNIGSLTCGPL